MNYDDVVLGRRSIRAFKPEPVPRAVLEEVIGLAIRAPSSMNSQPPTASGQTLHSQNDTPPLRDIVVLLLPPCLSRSETPLPL